jgi:hypothetical protein
MRESFFHTPRISDFFQHVDGRRLAHMLIDEMTWYSAEILVAFLGIALHIPTNATPNELRRGIQVEGGNSASRNSLPIVQRWIVCTSWTLVCLM